jgi:hypothetical protein
VIGWRLLAWQEKHVGDGLAGRERRAAASAGHVVGRFQHVKNYATGRLTRTAFHEAGHAVCAVVLDVPIGPVTVRSCAAYNGCAIVHHDIDLTDIGAYLHLSPRVWPPHLRQSLENYIMIKLAGPIGAAMAPDDTAGDPFAGEHWAHPDTDWPGPVELTPAEQHDLWRSTRPTVPHPTDAEDAAGMAWDLFGSAERAAWRHSRWLAEETRLLLEQHRDALARVAQALLEHKSLSGRAVRCLVAGDQDGTTSGIARDAPSDRGP